MPWNLALSDARDAKTDNINLFFFFLFLFKNNLAAAEITFSILRDARLLWGVSATDSTLGHRDHLLS